MERLNSEEILSETSEEELPEIENKKESIITFSKLNKYFIIPFIYPIFYVLSIFISSLIEESNAIKKWEFFNSIINELSYIFVGVFYLIPYFKVNYNKKISTFSNTEENDSRITYIYNESENLIDNYNPRKIMLLVILLSLIIAINDLIYTFIGNQTKVYIENFYFIFFIPLFSKIILKEKIYKHQCFSLIIAIFGIIFLIIPVLLDISIEDIIIWNSLFIIIGIITPLFLVIIKYILEKYYISPLKISFFVGIIALFVSCIGYIIYSLIKFKDLNYFTDFFDFSKKQ